MEQRFSKACRTAHRIVNQQSGKCPILIQAHNSAFATLRLPARDVSRAGLQSTRRRLHFRSEARLQVFRVDGRDQAYGHRSKEIVERRESECSAAEVAGITSGARDPSIVPFKYF